MTDPSTPMNDADAIDEALRSFVEAPVPPLAGEHARDLRARVLARLDAAQIDIARRRRAEARWQRVVVWTCAAALPLALAAGWAATHGRHVPDAEAEVRAVAGESEIVGGGTEHALGAPVAFGPDDELRTAADGVARASLPTGAQVDVGPSTRLRFAGSRASGRTRDRVDLITGRVSVAVPKLAAGDEVRVRTDDATVVVHGTKFTVERFVPAPGQPPETRVTVTQGRVVVLSDAGERTLTPGDTWVGSAAAPADDATGDAGPASPEPAAAPSDATSTLAVENALLTDALRLERAHRPAVALARLDGLLAKYPGSPLAETARIERLRALAAMGDMGRLRSEVDRYLTDYPQGSRGDVARIVAGAKGTRP